MLMLVADVVVHDGVVAAGGGAEGEAAVSEAM